MEQPPSKEARVPVNLRIKFRSETIEQFVERYASDVSRGGIFIRTREPLAVGTQLRFDFQLQDTSPLMAGEGTVVWIREHDPTRTGVTPGMGVRFDKLTPASQPILDRILVDKGKREPSGPVATSTTSVPATVSGKSGANPLPVRRPSSTFSTVDPAAAGAAARASAITAAPTPVAGSPVPAAPPAPATLVFGAVTAPGGAPPVGSRATLGPAANPPSRATPPMPTPMGLKSPTVGAGAIPTLETQSVLGRLATGPNLSAFGGAGGASRTKSPVPLARSPLTNPPGEVAAEADARAVPTAVEESERTQIADGLPDFAMEPDQPTHVGGPALGLAEIGASRAAAGAATARRTLTPAADARLSLDQGLAPPVTSPGMPPARTKSSDGGTGARISGGQPVVPATAAAAAATGTTAGAMESRDSPAPRLAPASSHPADTAAGPRATASAAIAARSQGGNAHKVRKRPTAFIVVGVLVGALAAVAIATRMSHREAEAPVATPAPAAAPSPPAAPDPGAPTAPTAVANKGEPMAAAGTENNPGETKPGEAKSGDTKPAEPRPAEAKAPEAKPADTKPVVAEAPPAPPPPAPARAAGARKQRLLARKKGAAAAMAKNDPASDLGSEAVEAASAADAAVGNVARITSTPAGAEVLIDGQTVGKTPFQGKDVDPAAPHALTVRKDGFETYEHMVSASDWVKGKGAGQSLKVTVKLRKTRGAGDGESAASERKPEKSGETAPAESTKTEPAPAAETP